jgi:hypothetical protein
MEKRRIERWLRRKVASEMGHSILFAAGCFAVGAVVLVLTFAITYVAIWFILDAAAFLGLGASPQVRVWIGCGGALFLVALLFWSNGRATRRHSESTAEGQDSEPGAQGTDSRQFPVWGSLLAYPGVGTLGVLDGLCTGPRLAIIGLSHLRRAWRLRGIDVAACGSVVAALLPCRARAQLRDLLRHPDVGQPLRQLAQLRDLEGIIFYRNAPYGFSLRSSWRQALTAELVGSFDDWDQPVPATMPGRGASIAEQVLGVSPGASPTEVETAYRRQIQSATDVAVERADPDLQRIASEHARAVRAAYDEFMARHAKAKEGLKRVSVGQVWDQHRRKETGGGPRAGL